MVMKQQKKGIWGFPEMGVPLYRWMVHFMENPTKMDDDWGYAYFRKPPFKQQETGI